MNPNSRYHMGWTDLHSAASAGDAERVRELLKKGADPNAKNEYGNTPLHEAASRGHVDVVRLLLEHGADPNIQNEDGWTPLHVAAIRGHVDVVRFLLEHGANPNARDKDGMTPLHLMSEYHEFLSLLLRYGDKDEILKYGKPPPPRWVPFHVEVAKLLLEHGADLNAKNESGWTPLHKAAFWGRVDIVATLLEHGADPDVQDKFGRTPLHSAALEGHVDVVRLLLEYGADPTAKNEDGDTPLDLARRRGHRKVVSLIEKFHIEGWLGRREGPSRLGAVPVRSLSDAVCKACCEAWRIISQVYDHVKEARVMTAKELEDLERLFPRFTGSVAALEEAAAEVFPDDAVRELVRELVSAKQLIESILSQLKQENLPPETIENITYMYFKVDRLREKLTCRC
jgi:ankyrin repeat protein